MSKFDRFNIDTSGPADLPYSSFLIASEIKVLGIIISLQ